MLQPIFEAKYIAIKWFNKNIITSIEEAILPIKIEILNESSYCMEIQTYTRIQNGLDGQLAFNILDEQENIQPFFINANNEKIYLIKIIDPKTKKIWWIENGTWSKQYNCRTSELWNHVGETNVYFGIVTCKINIRAVSFTKKQLELYLEDFKSDFWYLILKKDSLTQAKSKGITDNKIKILNNETIILLEKFIKDIQVILKNLKKELREIQGLKDIKKVKPIAKTFMEIVSKGYRKKLTSRDSEESYNVAENKYVHFMLYQVYIIVLNMIKASKHMGTFYENKRISEIDRLNKFSDFKIIDQEVLNNEIHNLEIKIEENSKELEKCISNQSPKLKKELEEINNLKITEIINNAIKKQIKLENNNFQEYHIKLGKRTDYFNEMQFWGEIKINGNWYKFENQEDSINLIFNKNIFENIFKEDNEYKIIASVRKNKIQKKDKKGFIHKRFFTYISELIPVNINLSNKNIRYQTLYIKLEKRQTDFEKRILFWGKARLENEKNWHNLKKEDSLSLEFDKNIFENILEEYIEYKITAFIEQSEKKKQGEDNNGIIHKRYFKYIEKIEKISISPDEQQLLDFKKEKEKLLLVNWKKELTDKEIKEQEKEKEALKNQIELLKNESNINSEYIEQLKPILRILKENLIKFNQLSISKDSYFPNSMTFIQNPYYQSSYKNYELIKNILGIDENLFLQIQKVELIGILDLPTLYERWCLLQIIKVLINHFRFVPEKNWKNNLAMQILSNPNKIYNIQINFSNEQIKRDVILWYEKILQNKKRPDFVLDIISTKTNKKHCLIMDAKFKEDVDVECLINSLYPDSKMNIISELDSKCPKSNGKIDKKNYSENNKNLVFILHPDSKKSIRNKRTPSYWGNDAYYGETNIFNYTWDNDKFPNHKYGSILLSPIRGENTYGDFLDNLQRLIGMAMQYTIEDNKNIFEDNKINPFPKEKEFCIKCGSSDIKLTYSGTSISQKGYYYQMDCQGCTHSFVYFYCWNCKYRLIKNGSYWSYHSFQVLNPFDIKCPNCAKYWNQKDKKEVIKSPEFLKMFKSNF